MSYLMAFEVLDDLATPGCPVCRGMRRAGQDWLHGLLHEDANDPRVRAALERHGGLCAHHVRGLVEVASADDDVLGLGILLEFLLAVSARRLERAARKGDERRWSPRRRGRHPPPERNCGACAAQARRAAAYLDILTTEPLGDELRQAIEAPSHSLCPAHVEAALAHAPGQASSQLLLRTARRRVEALRAEVSATLQTAASAGTRPAGDAVLWGDAPQWLAGIAHGPAGRGSQP